MKTSLIAAFLGLAFPALALAGECGSGTQSSLNGYHVRLGVLRDGEVIQVNFPAGVPAVTKRIIVRDISGNLVNGCRVTLDFSLCTGPAQDLRLAEFQPHHPGDWFDCATQRVSADSDAQGVATFRILGGAQRSAGNPPGYSGLPVPANACVMVTIGSQSFGRLVASAFDQDMTGGMTAADMGLIAGDRLSVINNGNAIGYRSRSDFDGDGTLSAADLGIAGAIRLDSVNQGATSSGSPACP